MSSGNLSAGFASSRWLRMPRKAIIRAVSSLFLDENCPPAAIRGGVRKGHLARAGPSASPPGEAAAKRVSFGQGNGWVVRLKSGCNKNRSPRRRHPIAARPEGHLGCRPKPEEKALRVRHIERLRVYLTCAEPPPNSYHPSGNELWPRSRSENLGHFFG